MGGASIPFLLCGRFAYYILPEPSPRLSFTGQFMLETAFQNHQTDVVKYIEIFGLRQGIFENNKKIFRPRILR
jgi:hypothetical protein